MNSFIGKVKSVQSIGSLSLVIVDVDGLRVSAVVTETPATAPYLAIDSSIAVLFKEGDVIIGRAPLTVSLQNQFPATIVAIEEGGVLSKVIVSIKKHKMASIITTNGVKKLGLEIGDEVMAMIKTNEILLAEA